MKKLLLALVLSAAVFLPRAQAISVLNPPYLGSISNEVFVQLTVVTNEINATNNLVANKKLLKVLLGAQKLIAKTKTNNVGGSKSLGVLNKSLGRSSLSNTFNPLIQGTADIYVSVFDNIFDALEHRVNSSYPGRAQDAARKVLAKFEAAIRNADTNANFLLVLKSLSVAAKGEIGAQKATVKAENAPLPPQQYKATITGALFGTFNFTPKPANAIAAIHSTLLNNLEMNGVSGVTSGSGFGTKVTVRQLFINIPNLTDGTTTYDVGSGSGKAFILYTVSKGGVGGSDGADGYEAVSGTLTVTVNKASKTAVGSYSFYAPGENTPTAASTSNGSFSVVWIE